MLAVYPQDKKAFIVIEESREQILLSGTLRDELDFSKWEMKSRPCGKGSGVAAVLEALDTVKLSVENTGPRKLHLIWECLGVGQP